MKKMNNDISRIVEPGKECANCQWHEDDGYCIHKYSEYSCEKVGDHWVCRWWQKPCNDGDAE